jgi:mono/diheme cytochrome c family protein
MRQLIGRFALLTLGIIFANGVHAASPTEVGKAEYRNSCALCHGIDGKATGGVTDLLKKAPPDLTTLAKRNGGKFPAERIAKMIDGREIVRGHGDRDMPAWGDRYSKDGVKAAAYYCDVPYKDTEKFVQNRINALMDYLASIQVK